MTVGEDSTTGTRTMRNGVYANNEYSHAPFFVLEYQRLSC